MSTDDSKEFDSGITNETSPKSKADLTEEKRPSKHSSGSKKQDQRNNVPKKTDKNRETESTESEATDDSSHEVDSKDEIDLFQWDERDLMVFLNKLYYRLKDIFEKCNSEMVENRDGVGYLGFVGSFFDVYNRHIRYSVFDKLSKNTSFQDKDKIGLNCFCVSINILNLNMDKVTEDKYIHQLLEVLDEFRRYSQSSTVARRITETILYCLCNYCNSTNNSESKRISFTKNSKQCLKNCFKEPQSSKIKLGAAIIIRFLDSTDDQLCDSARIYLSSINEYHGGRYLGVDKELIAAAIATESQNTENRGVEKESKTINILLFGEVGVGKSTWINGFANYLTYESLKEAENGRSVSVISATFTLTDSDFNEHKITYSIDSSKTESLENEVEQATEMPKSYVFNMQNLKIRIIDTPGMGDISGTEQDKKNMQNILNHLFQYKEINGIIILLKPNNSRLTLLFEFCVKEMVIHLHKDALKNIVICFTNARGSSYRPGDTMSALKELLNRNKTIDIKLTKDTVYCMDNEAVRYLMARNEIEFDEREREDYEISWRRAVNEAGRLISYISSLDPHMLQNSFSLNEVRRSIIEHSRPMAEIAKAIQINIDEIKEQKTTKIVFTKNKDELAKQLIVPTTKLKTVKLDHLRTVCTSSKCAKYITVEDGSLKLSYKSICHDRCHEIRAVTNVIGDPGLRRCTVMTRRWLGLYCTVCNCYLKTHVRINYEIINETVYKEDPEIRKRIDEENGFIEAVEIHRTNLENKLKQLKYAQKRLIEISAHFACFLKHFSIIPLNDELRNYLDHLIEVEERNVKISNNSKTLEGLREVKERYEKAKELIEERIEKYANAIQNIEVKNINELMKELRNLPTIGTMLGDIMTGSEKPMKPL